MRRFFCTLVVVTFFGSALGVAQRSGSAPATGAPAKGAPAKGAPAKGAPAKAAPPAPSGPPPQMSVNAIRVIGAGLGANGSELHAFNDRPGTAVAFAILAPTGSGIVDIDERGSRVDSFTDDKGQSLLEEGRFGSFPKISEDRSAALVDVEVRGRPSAGATSVSVQGSVAMTLATGSKPTRIPNVRLAEGQTMKLGPTTITVKRVTPGEESTEVTLALSRTILNTISAIKFFDAKGEAIEARRTGSGYMNDAAEVEMTMKGKANLVAVEFDVWQNMRAIKHPFNLSAGLSFAANDPKPSAAAGSGGGVLDRPAAKPISNVPVIAPGPNEGAASIEAVLTQMQAAGAAGKGRELIAVIFPDDRTTYAQIIALGVTFSMMGNIGDEKAADKAQKDIDALFAKHKLQMPLNKEPAEIFKNTDVAAFITDSFAYMKTQLKKGDNLADALPVPKGKIQGLATDGDGATGKLDDRELKFSRVNGKWFIRVTD
jgi:hypothetical protein